MLIFPLLAVALLTILVVIDTWLFPNGKQQRIGIRLRIGLLSLVLAAVMARYVLRVGLLLAVTPSLMDCVKYIALTLVIYGVTVAVRLFFNYLVKTKKILVTRSTGKRTLLGVILFTLISVLVAVGSGILLVFYWVNDTMGHLTMAQILFHLRTNNEGADENIFFEMINGPLLLAIGITIIFILLCTSRLEISVIRKKKQDKAGADEIEAPKKHSTILKPGYLQKVVCALTVAAICTGATLNVRDLKMVQFFTAQLNSSSFIKDNYVKPTEDKLVFPKKKRNIIHIYLESYESSYFSKELGGYMDVNLMPDMTKLAKEGINFSHNNLYGGNEQTFASGWSIAGMVNMEGGVPLKVNEERNSYGLNGKFLPGLVTIGDILYKQGYQTSMMIGSDAKFAGQSVFYKTHGNFDVFDYNYAREHGYIPPNYRVFWGFEDERLYKFAQQKLTSLAANNKPFYFVMENIDTHGPHGWIPDHAERRFSDPYANAVFNSQKDAVKFIRWIQQQPFYKNTTIVINGDHLSMANDFFRNWDHSYRRAPFNLVLNAVDKESNTRNKNREFAPVDMFPTILSSAGIKIKGDRLGLGTDLFSDKKTLVERDGYENFNNELLQYSPFFAEHIVRGQPN